MNAETVSGLAFSFFIDKDTSKTSGWRQIDQAHTLLAKGMLALGLLGFFI